MPKPTANPGKGQGSGKSKNVQDDTTSDTGDGSGSIIGTSDADHILGTDGDDYILGLDGDDVINGRTGTNTMDGGEGSDTYMVYGRGNITQVTDTGSVADTDTIMAGTSYTLIGMSDFGPDSGVEVISSGGFGSVDIEGTATANRLDFSETQLDGIGTINAGFGDDTVIGSSGDDTIFGAGDNDVLAGGGGSDYLNGGEGMDTFTFSPEDWGIDTVADFSTAEGDKLDLTAYAEAGTVTGWSLSDQTPDNGIDDPLLSVLYENGDSVDVATLYGVTEEESEAEGFSDHILLI